MKKLLIALMTFAFVLMLVDCSKMPVKPNSGKNNKGAVKTAFFTDASEKGTVNSATAGKGRDVLKDTGNAFKDFFSGFKQKKSSKKQPFVLTPKVYLKIMGGAAIALAAGLVFLQFRPR